MAKQINDTQPVTQAFFVKEFKKRDVKITEIKNTTKALWQQVLKLEERIENLEENDKKHFENFSKIDKRFDSIDERFENLEVQRRQDKDDLMNKMDFIIGELQTMREENTVGAYQLRELRKQVDKHEEYFAKFTVL